MKDAFLIVRKVTIMLVTFCFKRRISKEGSDNVEQVHSLLCDIYHIIEKYGRFDDMQEFERQFFYIKSDIKEKLQRLKESVPHIRMYMNGKTYGKFENFYYRLDKRFAHLEKEIDSGNPNDLMALVEAQNHYNAFVRDLLSEQYKNEYDNCLRKFEKLLRINDLFANNKIYYEN